MIDSYQQYRHPSLDRSSSLRKNGFDVIDARDRRLDAIPMHGTDTAVLSVENGCEFSMLQCTTGERTNGVKDS